MKVPPPRLLLAAAFLLQSLISYRTDATRLSAASSAPSGGAWRNHTEWTRDTVAVDYKGRRECVLDCPDARWAAPGTSSPFVRAVRRSPG